MARPLLVGSAILASLLVGCAGPNPPADSVPQGPSRMRVEMFGGFEKDPAALETGAVVLVVDSTSSMASTSGFGPSRVRAMRAAAKRFAEGLAPENELELYILGNSAQAQCDTEPARVYGDRREVVDKIGRLRARGRGSLAGSLDRLAAEDSGVGRVVAITAVEDDCNEDLCEAVERLASRGVRLDLVLIGDAATPACVTRLTAPELDGVPVPWKTNPRAHYRVESTGDDAAVLVCGETGGVPVQVSPGKMNVVVDLDPPLSVERDFTPGTRWVLQVLDFPNLDPPERQWRWLAELDPQSARTPLGTAETP